MKKVILFLVMATGLFAQSNLTLTGPVSVKAGQSVNLDLTLSSNQSPAALLWTMTAPTGFTATGAAGASLQTATKTLDCYQVTCLAAEMNTNVIPNGIVAKYTVQVGPSVAAGLYSFPLTNLSAASAEGNEILLTSGVTAYQLRVLGKTDLNGDGVTNRTDFMLMWDQVIGRSPCTGDQNGDAKCGLSDLFAILRATL